MRIIEADREDTPRLQPLNTRVPPHVRIINGALTDADANSSSGLVLQGMLDVATLHFLKCDGYQRPLEEREDIYRALTAGKVLPNIDIGVRGQDFVSDGSDFLIRSDAYIVDGRQRVGNAMRFIENSPATGVRLFATIHFDTNYDWEEQRFNELNLNIRRISPNKHLFNLRSKSRGVLTLYGLSTNAPSFPLYEKVSWDQKMRRGELITAAMMAQVVRDLHGHSTVMGGTSANHLAASLDLIADNISLGSLRQNTQTFFSIINDIWPFENIGYRKAATQVKGQFLRTVAKLFSDHLNFWNERDTALMVAADDRRKLGKFPILDRHIVDLSGSGGSARHILFNLLVDHMNSGRRTQRLELRPPASSRRR